jgi:CBS-domain-containing membrane protein|tara:strand:- start:28 stop:291 length:264 start_codon:yes stop_codon:yes gene_type:complete
MIVAWWHTCYCILAVVRNSLALMMFLGSFGASYLLIFAYSASPFAWPRNVIGGHVIATFTGLVFMTLFGIQWWSMAMAVGTAIAITT